MSQNQGFDPSQAGEPAATPQTPAAPEPPAAPQTPTTAAPGAQPAAHPAPTPTGPAVPVAQPSQVSASNGLALASLITGLLGLVIVVMFFMFVDFGGGVLFVGAALGLVGFILGIVALKKRQSKGMAITGLVTGLIALLLSLAIFVFALLFIGALASAFM